MNNQKYRIEIQHLITYNRFSYPRVAPFFTLEEAKEKQRDENRNYYIRANIIDENGLVCG